MTAPCLAVQEFRNFFQSSGSGKRYLTPEVAQGFTPHYDTHDVFILQIAGSKQCWIYDSPIQLPLKSQQYHPAAERLGSPLYQFDVTAGDVIYIPHGYINEAATAESTSLSILLWGLSAILASGYLGRRSNRSAMRKCVLANHCRLVLSNKTSSLTR